MLAFIAWRERVSRHTLTHRPARLIERLKGGNSVSGKRMQRRTCLAIVLAAGEGTRMRSAMPKALHAIGGRTLLAHVLSAAIKAGGGEIAVVVGPDHDAVAQAARALAPKARTFKRTERPED